MTDVMRVQNDLARLRKELTQENERLRAENAELLEKNARLRDDIVDARDVADISRCNACGRLGLLPSYICVFCGHDPTAATDPGNRE